MTSSTRTQMNTKKRRRRKKKKQARTGCLTVLLCFVCFLILVAFFLFVRHSLSSGRQTDGTIMYASPIGPAPSLPIMNLDAAAMQETNGFRSYRDETYTGISGLDISSHQGTIDWASVSQTPAEFVIIRAGFRGYEDGSLVADSALEENLAGAASAGLKVGLYFFSQAINAAEATEEAEFVLAQLQYREIDYPIFFDWEPVEDDTARTGSISKTELTACAEAFCSTITAAGYRAGIYFNLSQSYNAYNLYALKDYSFWLAEYAELPSFPYKIDFWQYSSAGSCSGIGCTVDLNMCFTENDG